MSHLKYYESLKTASNSFAWVGMLVHLPDASIHQLIDMVCIDDTIRFEWGELNLEVKNKVTILESK